MAEIKNQQVAKLLERIAGLLETKQANPFRVQAYRQAAGTVRAAGESLGKLLEEGGEESLQDLPQIGEGISGVIADYLRSGRSRELERLLGETAPEELFQQVPGIGETLAERIAENLEVNTLEELEQAAHDGRLRKIDGFGSRKVENIRLSLAGMLSSAAQRRTREKEESKPQPPVSLLLEVDQEYRQKAARDQLRRIAPKRFNPDDEAWLPILDTKQKGWNFTVLFSNTARAHELGKIDDWVVVYYQRGGMEDQATVVTETKGELEGERVIRGREAECLQHYRHGR